MTTNTTTAPTARRLVNCYVAYSNRGDLLLGDGAYGVPEQAMQTARTMAAIRGTNVLGVMIHDVNTGEQFAWPLFTELDEATAKRDAARIAFDTATTNKARRLASEDLTFWQGKVAMLGAMAVSA